MLYNIPEERISHFHSGGSLKSCMSEYYYLKSKELITEDPY
jgi:hypothetical protein